jgi:hypothetical protein
MTTKENIDRPKTTSGIRKLRQEDPATARIRRDLALIVTGLLVVIALVAAFQIGAMPVLDKMLPLVAIIFGFFFGHRASKF